MFCEDGKEIGKNLHFIFVEISITDYKSFISFQISQFVQRLAATAKQPGEVGLQRKRIDYGLGRWHPLCEIGKTFKLQIR